MSMSIEKQASSSSPNPSQSCWQLPTMDSQQYPYYNYYVREREREREQMFEKPLTPSDVGKLNRLVIPKQYAERYFPIDSESGEKGLLLSFEDEEGGKTWKFRYSYWTSSQSYVLTKGWSRFVKDKRLDAGDVVLFQRCRPGTNDDRLFIACRRRSSLSNETLTATATATTEEDNAPCFYMNTVGSGEGGSGEAMPARRRLRLFGVNLECGPEPPQQLVSSGSWSSQFTNNA